MISEKKIRQIIRNKIKKNKKSKLTVGEKLSLCESRLNIKTFLPEDLVKEIFNQKIKRAKMFENREPESSDGDDEEEESYNKYGNISDVDEMLMGLYPEPTIIQKAKSALQSPSKDIPKKKERSDEDDFDDLFSDDGDEETAVEREERPKKEEEKKEEEKKEEEKKEEEKKEEEKKEEEKKEEEKKEEEKSGFWKDELKDASDNSKRDKITKIIIDIDKSILNAGISRTQFLKHMSYFTGYPNGVSASTVVDHFSKIGDQSNKVDQIFNAYNKKISSVDLKDAKSIDHLKSFLVVHHCINSVFKSMDEKNKSVFLAYIFYMFNLFDENDYNRDTLTTDIDENNNTIFIAGPNSDHKSIFTSGKLDPTKQFTHIEWLFTECDFKFFDLMFFDGNNISAGYLVKDKNNVSNNEVVHNLRIESLKAKLNVEGNQKSIKFGNDLLEASKEDLTYKALLFFQKTLGLNS